MKIFVNGSERIIRESSTLVSILEQVGITQTTGIALAVNEQVIPKTSWENHLIKENDNVLVIRATKGG